MNEGEIGGFRQPGPGGHEAVKVVGQDYSLTLMG